MKTLLIYPRFWPYSSPPLGLMYIASTMKRRKKEVKIIDCTFRMTYPKLLKEISDYSPDLVGISLMTDMVKNLRRLIKDIRKLKENICIVVGGPHPRALPQEMISSYGADIVVTGEGEITMLELVERLQEGESLASVKGVFYRQNGRIVKTSPPQIIPNLDYLPFPDRENIPMQDYLHYNIGRSSWAVPRPSTTIMGSRGCPFNCTFCGTKLLHGRKVRYRSPQNILDEIDYLIRRYRIKGLWFNDDSFTLNKKWVEEIISGMQKRNIKLGWGCNTRVDLVDKNILKIMKEGGCRFISFGVESGVQEVLDRYLKKSIKIEQIKQAFRLTEETGIFTQATFMVGIPGESLADMETSLKFAKELEPDCIQVSIATPFPATELVNLAYQQGNIETLDWEKLDYMERGVITTDKFNPDQVRDIQKRFLKEFYFRKKYFLTQLRRIRSLEDLLRNLRGFYQLIGGAVSPLSLVKSYLRKRYL